MNYQKLSRILRQLLWLLWLLLLAALWICITATPIAKA